MARSPCALRSPKRDTLNSCEVLACTTELLFRQKLLVTPCMITPNSSTEWIFCGVKIHVIIVIVVTSFAQNAIVRREDIAKWRGCHCWSGSDRRSLAAMAHPPPAGHGWCIAPRVLFVRRFVRVAEPLARTTPVIAWPSAWPDSVWCGDSQWFTSVREAGRASPGGTRAL